MAHWFVQRGFGHHEPAAKSCAENDKSGSHPCEENARVRCHDSVSIDRNKRGGLIGAAVIGGLASRAYAYGPGYGYYGYPYAVGYAPAYSGGYGYGPYPWGGYTTTYCSGYSPAYYGYRYRRVVRPAFAYYGGAYPRRIHHRHRW
jgi:hypothetical protein